MAKFQNRYRIEPNRQQYWDYSTPAQYFLTVCIDDFQCILGDVVNDEIMLIPIIMGKLKMITSKQINILNNTADKRNLQRDYYDHIIRNYQSYLNIKNYIINNPKNQGNDRFNN